MKDTLIRCCLIVVVIYFGVNWAADNPLKVKMLRKEINRIVDQGFAEGRTLYNDLTTKIVDFGELTYYIICNPRREKWILVLAIL